MGREIGSDSTGVRRALKAIALRPSFETPALGGLLRMRTECAAATSQPRMSMSLILRRPQSGRLEGRGARSDRPEMARDVRSKRFAR
ncbi:hypothetical protein TSA1_22950 [Bradyrhizobium nitroreducens]|uniref:Uncharacterized protein n=1 Tax=Bradyrhizobium nitroreducens TaxID=709803 RepID=A0A2M6UFB7_9BRAD|nr:hypothetical protein TSA1_22950 [Bradyrhizobium nitroreducens]